MVIVTMSLDLDAILAAHQRIEPHIHRTLVLTSERLNEASGASLFFKISRRLARLRHAAPPTQSSP